MDPYTVLGVRPGAGADEVRRAYLRLARLHHPDRLAGASPAERAGAERTMREVNEAWSILGDRARRDAWDRANGVGTGFVPFTPDGPDEPDPRDAPDVPYEPYRRRTSGDRALTMVPVLLFAGAVCTATLGAIVGLAPLVALGAVLFVLSCLGFVVAPLVALSEARRHDR